jgi:hypothetical protein
VYVGQEREGNPAEMSHRRGLLYHAAGAFAKENGAFAALARLKRAICISHDCEAF